MPQADVVPAYVMIAGNVDKVQALVSPGLEWCIKHGWPMAIIDSQPVQWPKAYAEAVEKHAGDLPLAADG